MPPFHFMVYSGRIFLSLLFGIKCWRKEGEGGAGKGERNEPVMGEFSPIQSPNPVEVA